MFINLTPHAINLPACTIEPAGTVARCAEITELAGEFDGVQIIRRRYGQVEGLPDPQDGVIYIVSLLVRMACPERTDLASPGDLVRDANGAIVGAKNLVIS
jgi:hypothetical protein